MHKKIAKIKITKKLNSEFQKGKFLLKQMAKSDANTHQTNE